MIVFFFGHHSVFPEVQERQECQYGENCTFAYCQEEIDVWTQERKGALSRELLFDPLGTNERRALSVTRLLQLHMGMFMFLCEVMCAFIFNTCLIPRNDSCLEMLSCYSGPCFPVGMF